MLGKSVKPNKILHVESCWVRFSPIEHPHERFKSGFICTNSGQVHDNNGKILAFDERVELFCWARTMAWAFTTVAPVRESLKATSSDPTGSWLATISRLGVQLPIL